MLECYKALSFLLEVLLVGHLKATEFNILFNNCSDRLMADIHVFSRFPQGSFGVPPNSLPESSLECEQIEVVHSYPDPPLFQVLGSARLYREQSILVLLNFIILEFECPAR